MSFQTASWPAGAWTTTAGGRAARERECMRDRQAGRAGTHTIARSRCTCALVLRDFAVRERAPVESARVRVCVWL
eukprot:118118-Pleurochrysis_carterae.AAC.1